MAVSSALLFTHSTLIAMCAMSLAFMQSCIARHHNKGRLHMSTTDTTAQTSEGEGKNTADVQGAGTQTGKTEDVQTKTLTQDEVNKVVQARLTEERTRAQAK